MGHLQKLIYSALTALKFNSKYSFITYKLRFFVLFASTTWM